MIRLGVVLCLLVVCGVATAVCMSRSESSPCCDLPSPYYLGENVQHSPVGSHVRLAREAAIDDEALRTLAEAAKAYQVKLAVIAHNLANVETVGFKRGRVNLENLPYRHEELPGAEDTAGQSAPVGVAVGTGVRVAGVRTDFRQGTFHQTGSDLDLAIEGRGFFQLTDPRGEILYTRAGNFSNSANGNLVIGSAKTGRLLEPPITVPADATAVTITPEGNVSVRQPGSASLSQIGQIELATFVNPEGLLKRGENLYAETEASGTATLANPGHDAVGRLHQGALEASNVDADQEQIEWNKTAATLKRLRRLLHVE